VVVDRAFLGRQRLGGLQLLQIAVHAGQRRSGCWARQDL
jgi:hypothetical protein